MITGLTASIATVAAVICAVFYLYARNQNARNRSGLVLAVIVVLLVASSVGVYGSKGRYNDWQNAETDQTFDPRLAAKITQARRTLEAKPNSLSARTDLAELYMEAGLFAESAKTTEDAIKHFGPSAELYGLKARALYYRDQRNISRDTKEALDEAFDLNPAEPSSCMLMAEDAYRRHDYEKAIEQWQIVLDAHSAPTKESAIKRAIDNARAKLCKEKSK